MPLPILGRVLKLIPRGYYWCHSFLDIATSFLYIIWNLRTLSDIMVCLQDVQKYELSLLVNCINVAAHFFCSSLGFCLRSFCEVAFLFPSFITSGYHSNKSEVMSCFSNR